MKLHGCNAASIGYASNPEEPEQDRRADYITYRIDQIWCDPHLLELALDDASIPFSYETARLLSSCLQRLTSSMTSEMTDAEQFVLSVADDLDNAVRDAAIYDADTRLI